MIESQQSNERDIVNIGLKIDFVMMPDGTMIEGNHSVLADMLNMITKSIQKEDGAS